MILLREAALRKTEGDRAAALRQISVGRPLRFSHRAIYPKYFSYDCPHLVHVLNQGSSHHWNIVICHETFTNGPVVCDQKVLARKADRSCGPLPGVHAKEMEALICLVVHHHESLTIGIEVYLVHWGNIPVLCHLAPCPLMSTHGRKAAIHNG